MGLVRFALRNPHAVVVMALAILVIGLTSLAKLPVDILPTFKTPAVQILTLYPGMPAEVMEKDITSRLERWTGQSNGVARQESKSMIGVSVVRDYFREDIDPNTAMSQVTSLAISDLYYLPPGTVPPMVMPFDPTASIPLALLSVSSPQYDETKLYDVAYFDLRNRLQGITGVIAPAVYGGKLRRILSYVDPDKLQARGLSPLDVIQGIKQYNTLIPTGSAKIGNVDYQINANGMVSKVPDLNKIPLKLNDGAPVYVGDVAHTEDTSAIQTNVVRVNGKRQVYIPLYRQPGANTIQVVEGVKEALAQIRSRLPQGINLDVVLDQSVFVRQAINNLIHEGLLGALLAAVMILFFLGSFRSTLIISLAIPLSILAAFIGLYWTGDSINAMTLGGLALAVGRLVDDAIVVLENTHRHLAMAKPPVRAAFDAAREVAMPVLVATITTVVVFFPVVFLTGMGKFLFTPLARAVAFSMSASYLVAMTLVPVCCATFLHHGEPRATTADDRPPTAPTPAETASRLAHVPGGRSSAVVGRHPHLAPFDRLSGSYGRGLRRCLSAGPAVLGGAFLAFVASLFLYPAIGKELFPRMDPGQFTMRVRSASGTRIERTERRLVDVEKAIQAAIPARDLKMMITNIGVLLDWPAAYTPNSGPMDSFVLVQLAEHRAKSAPEYASLLREALSRRFPDLEFSFDTGGMVTAALNNGLPSPINIQVEGNKLDVAQALARELKSRIEAVRGTADVRVQQRTDYPQIAVDVDRTKAAYVGLTQQDVVKNVVTALNSSVNFDPSFWIDENNGNHYFIGAQYPEADIRNLQTLQDLPVTGANQKSPALLKNLATFRRTTAPAEVNHLNINRVTDVFANVEGRDVGSVAAEIQRMIDQMEVPSGYRIQMRGEVQSMQQSFGGLGFGFLLAVVLVYLVMVAQFRSFLDPFIIMFAVPLGLIGVLVTLWVTGTTFNVQSFLGTIFMVGIAVSNSILIVDFANRLRLEGLPLDDALVDACRIRLRPILMTSLAAILALLPMAIGLGRGAEANIPLARAVVGGLLVSTLLTLFVVPVLYQTLKRRAPVPAGPSAELI
jgi:multidrug efflux pump subunit AcrB